ncbi:MAG TPA: hypothetical protein VF803_02625 [Candidatus Paceibacterota bacterium]
MSAIALRNNLVSAIITPLLELAFAAALIVFAWGVVQFLIDISQGGDGKDGRTHMLWGIIGIAIMIGAYGILAIVTNTFGVNLPTQ